MHGATMKFRCNHVCLKLNVPVLPTVQELCITCAEVYHPPYSSHCSPFEFPVLGPQESLKGYRLKLDEDVKVSAVQWFR